MEKILQEELINKENKYTFLKKQKDILRTFVEKIEESVPWKIISECKRIKTLITFAILLQTNELIAQKSAETELVPKDPHIKRFLEISPENLGDFFVELSNTEENKTNTSQKVFFSKMIEKDGAYTEEQSIDLDANKEFNDACIYSNSKNLVVSINKHNEESSKNLYKQEILGELVSEGEIEPRGDTVMAIGNGTTKEQAVLDAIYKMNAQVLITVESATRNDQEEKGGYWNVFGMYTSIEATNYFEKIQILHIEEKEEGGEKIFTAKVEGHVGLKVKT